ncbi:MAG: hypothetical protein J5379_08030 [Clostridiales bacterium]|nr:hypothetical protein [Clostridiales bacterium]
MRICRFCMHEQESGDFCDACGSPFSADKVDFGDGGAMGGEAMPDLTQSTFSDPTQSAFPDPSQSAFPNPTNNGFPDPAQSGFPDPTQSTFPDPTKSDFSDPAQGAFSDVAQSAFPDPTQSVFPDVTQQGAAVTGFGMQQNQNGGGQTAVPMQDNGEASQKNDGAESSNPSKGGTPGIMYSARERNETVYLNSKCKLNSSYKSTSNYAKPSTSYSDGVAGMKPSNKDKKGGASGKTANGKSGASSGTSGAVSGAAGVTTGVAGAVPGQTNVNLGTQGTVPGAPGATPVSTAASQQAVKAEFEERSEYQGKYNHCLTTLGLSILGLPCCCGMSTVSLILAAIAYSKYATIKKGTASDPEKTASVANILVIIADVFLVLAALVMLYALITSE